ncbi:MAG: hypothetical protein JEZ09_19160 [Salinivirgaceae bacterium]|nr:hypothetical protein [Salinivirgaceae bacterium]
MKKRCVLFVILAIGMGLAFTSCGEDEPDDACSNELGNIQEQYKCEKPVTPEICTVDGVDDHWILDGVEYSCGYYTYTTDSNGSVTDSTLVVNCNNIPQAMITAMQEDYGCGNTKSLDMVAINEKLSKQAEQIIAKLKMEYVLCNN